MDNTEVKTNIAAIALETVDALNNIYVGQYETVKHYLASLTRMAVELAANKKSDADNIRQLGEGWVAEETWAIALYSAVRHDHKRKNRGEFLGVPPNCINFACNKFFNRYVIYCR